MSPVVLVNTITIMAIIFGILGAKLFAIIEDWERFISDPINVFLSNSCLTVYGGMLMAFTVIIFYVRWKGLKVYHVMDAAAPALVAGYGLGRMGCHLSGDGDWGIVNVLDKPSWWFFPDWTWAHYFPRNVVKWKQENIELLNSDCIGDYCHQLNSPVFPTSFYEMAVMIIFLMVLWGMRKRIIIPGLLFFVYLFINGVERF